MNSSELLKMAEEKPLYTHKQLCLMMGIVRSWTLNNPSGPLPPIPINTEHAASVKDLYDTLPEYKKPHKIIKILMWFKII